MRLEVNKNENYSPVKFGELSRGDIFMYQNKIYIKSDEETNHNSTCLEDGRLIFFRDDNDVFNITAILNYTIA